MNVNIYRWIQNTNRLGDNKLKKNGGGLIEEKRCEALKLKKVAMATSSFSSKSQKAINIL